jgi:hypothetical protein
VPDHSDQVTLPAYLNPQHAETGLGIVEGHPLHQPSQGLGRGGLRQPWVGRRMRAGSEDPHLCRVPFLQRLQGATLWHTLKSEVASVCILSLAAGHHCRLTSPAKILPVSLRMS